MERKLSKNFFGQLGYTSRGCPLSWKFWTILFHSLLEVDCFASAIYSSCVFGFFLNRWIMYKKSIFFSPLLIRFPPPKKLRNYYHFNKFMKLSFTQAHSFKNIKILNSWMYKKLKVEKKENFANKRKSS